MTVVQIDPFPSIAAPPIAAAVRPMRSPRPQPFGHALVVERGEPEERQPAEATTLSGWPRVFPGL